MKNSLVWGVALLALASGGCGDVGEESLGETSEALLTGYWLPTFLSPLAPVGTSSGYQVCRPTSGVYTPVAGWTQGTNCVYPSDGAVRVAASFDRLEKSNYTWVTVGSPCGSRWNCKNPSFNMNRVVGTAGHGICEYGGRTGHFDGESCTVAWNSSSYVTYHWSNNIIRGLQKP